MDTNEARRILNQLHSKDVSTVLKQVKTAQDLQVLAQTACLPEFLGCENVVFAQKIVQLFIALEAREQLPGMRSDRSDVASLLVSSLQPSNDSLRVRRATRARDALQTISHEGCISIVPSAMRAYEDTKTQAVRDLLDSFRDAPFGCETEHSVKRLAYSLAHSLGFEGLESLAAHFLVRAVREISAHRIQFLCAFSNVLSKPDNQADPEVLIPIVDAAREKSFGIVSIESLHALALSSRNYLLTSDSDVSLQLKVRIAAAIITLLAEGNPAYPFIAPYLSALKEPENEGVLVPLLRRLTCLPLVITEPVSEEHLPKLNSALGGAQRKGREVERELAREFTERLRLQTATLVRANLAQAGSKARLTLLNGGAR